jgi:hypothetical protein
MHPRYTPHILCQALGLPGFLPAPSNTDPPFTLRLLLKPSWSPELCLTWRQSPSHIHLETRAFNTQYWPHALNPDAPQPASFAIDQSTLPPKRWLQSLSQLQLGLKTIQREITSQTNHFLDGMSIDLVLCTGLDQTHLHIHASTPTQGLAFLPTLLTHAKSSITNPACKSALSSTFVHLRN